MLRNVHVDIIIKRPENRPDCHCYVGYGMGCRNGTWRPEWYLISPDQALPNCVWAPLVPRAQVLRNEVSFRLLALT